MKRFSAIVAVVLFAACAVTGCSKKPEKAEASPSVDTTLTTESDPRGLISAYANQVKDCEEAAGLSQDQTQAACSASGVTAMKLEFMGYCEFSQGGSIDSPAKTQFAKCLTTPESASAGKDVQDLLLLWAAPAEQCSRGAPIGCPETIEAARALFQKGWCQMDDKDIYTKPIPQWRTCPPNATFDDPYEQEGGDVPDSQESESVSLE